jgi:hypothetical protein
MNLSIMTLTIRIEYHNADCPHTDYRLTEWHYTECIYKVSFFLFMHTVTPRAENLPMLCLVSPS